MIKIYLFDWMKTLANVELDETEVLTNEEHRALVINKYNFLDFPENRRKIIDDYLRRTKHFLYPDSEEIIKKLKNQGYKLGVVSDMYEITFNRVQEQFKNFVGLFDTFVASAMVGVAKPSLTIYFKALDNIDPEGEITHPEVIMVGDNKEKDIEPALTLGMQARLIDRKTQKLEDVI